MQILDVLTSERRREILSLLAEKPRTLKELSTILNSAPSGLFRQVKKLEEVGLVEKAGSTFRLTGKGEVAFLALNKLRNIALTLERDPEFWKVHDLSGIPPEFKLRLDEIGEYKVIRSDDEVLKHHKVFSSIYTNSKFVRVAAAVMFPNHPQMFAEMSKNADVEVVVTSRIVDVLKEYYSNEFQSFIKNGGRIYVNDEVRMTVIVTERALCLGMFLKNGKYDTECGLLSFDSGAIKWGFEIFRYFKERAREVEFM